MADHTSTRPIREVDPRNAEPINHGCWPRVAVVPTRGHIEQPGPERQVAIQTSKLLIRGHLTDKQLSLEIWIGTLTNSFGG
jgi:hypothetical protein